MGMADRLDAPEIRRHVAHGAVAVAGLEGVCGEFERVAIECAAGGIVPAADVAKMAADTGLLLQSVGNAITVLTEDLEMLLALHDMREEDE